MKGIQINDLELIQEKIRHLFHAMPHNNINAFAEANLIIINPSALIDIFLIIRVSTTLNPSDILGLFKLLNKILSKQSVNCLVVYSEGILSSSGVSKKSFASYLIDYYYELKERQMPKEVLLEIEKMLKILVKYNYLEKSVIKTIYGQSLKEYYQGFISYETVENSLRILHVI